MNVIEPLIKVISERITRGESKESIKKEVFDAGYTEEEFQTAYLQAESVSRGVVQGMPSLGVDQGSIEHRPKTSIVLMVVLMFLMIGVVGVISLRQMSAPIIDLAPDLPMDTEISAEAVESFVDEAELLQYSNGSIGITFSYPNGLILSESSNEADPNIISPVPDKLVDLTSGESFVTIYTEPVVVGSLGTEVSLIKERIVGDQVVRMYYETTMNSDKPITIGIGWGPQESAVDNLAYIFFTPANLTGDLRELPDQIFYQLELVGGYDEEVLNELYMDPDPVSGDSASNSVPREVSEYSSYGSSGMVKVLSDFKPAGQTWYGQFMTQANSVPRDSYRAFYFDTTNNGEVTKNELVSKVGIRYVRTGDSGIMVDPQNFGAYWVGDVSIPKTEVYVVSVAQSWSESRVIIDGHVVATGQSDTEVMLEQGTHRVEVEFVNNWHTTDFSVTLSPKTTVYTAAEIKNEINMLTQDFQNWYVGAYESTDTYRNSTVYLANSSKDIVLFLSSYSQIHWNINPNSNLVAVVYASYEPGSTVSGVPPGVSVFKTTYNDLVFEYQLNAQCDSYSGEHFSYCEDIDQLTKIDRAVMNLTGKRMDGFSGSYGVGQMTVPTIFMTDQKRDEITESYETVRDQNEQELQEQSIENIF